MEADKVTEEPHTTMDTEEHPSSKDPSAEDSQEPPIPETPFKPSISETPLEPLTSETLLEPSISETPLEAHTSESHMVLPASEAPLETHASETALEPSMSETPLEARTSETPLQPSISETLLETHISESHMVLPAPKAPLETHTSETSLKPSMSETPLEAHTSETPLEPSISETPLEAHTSETPLEPSISETPLETHTSESHIVPSTSQAPLETYTSENLLEPSISGTPVGYSEIPLETPIPETLLETDIFKVPEKHLSFHTSSQDHVTVSSSDTPKEDLSKYSPTEVSWTRRSIQISESEILQKHSLSSPSAPVHLDTSAKETEEEGEDKERVDATDSTTHTAQPGQQLGKKKGKKGVSHYTVHPVVPTKQAELVEVAKAMPREKFGAPANYLFQWEKNAALNAIQTGLYIGWRCPHYLWDCFRIGDESKCFCGHLLKEHQIISDISVPCNVGQCRCLMFCFIPSRPEEVGEFWLKRRATFDPKAWRAQCRCKHSHEDHAATGSHPCRVKGCCCNCFESNFLCAACDRRWEEHETFFETEETRRRGGRPHGADYVPFAEMPTLREAIVSNSDSEALQKQGPSGCPGSHPRPPGPPGPQSLWPDPMSDAYT